MFKRKLINVTAATATICILAGAPAFDTYGAMSAQEARATVERQFGVKVLKISNIRLAGKRVILLTVMSPGGDTNSAFQVNRLAIDLDTGKLVSGFRHLPSGYNYAEGSGANDPNRQPTGVLRQGWNWR